jgi:hypothetical protein
VTHALELAPAAKAPPRWVVTCPVCCAQRIVLHQSTGHAWGYGTVFYDREVERRCREAEAAGRPWEAIALGLGMPICPLSGKSRRLARFLAWWWRLTRRRWSAEELATPSRLVDDEGVQMAPLSRFSQGGMT